MKPRGHQLAAASVGRRFASKGARLVCCVCATGTCTLRLAAQLCSLSHPFTCARRHILLPYPVSLLRSPYLKFGCLSPRLFHAKLQQVGWGAALGQCVGGGLGGWV